MIVTDAQGRSLHYAASGDPSNELVVLIHPAFTDHTSFALQAEALAQRFRVAAIDMPGHGSAQPPPAQTRVADTVDLVAQLIADAGHARAHLVGVSLGSLVAQALAARHPALAMSLTVVGGYPIGGTAGAVQRTQAFELLKILGLLLVSPRRFRRYVARASTHTPQARALFERGAQGFARGSFRAFAGMDRITPPAFQPAPAPLLIAVGAHERPLLRRVAEDWHRREPGSLLRVIPDAGHCANMDNPAAFNAALLGFLRRQPQELGVSRAGAGWRS